MKKKAKQSIGLDLAAPKKVGEDKNCPFHGNLKVRGRIFRGTVVKAKAAKTATVEWTRQFYIRKYERFEKRRTKLQVHNPSSINAAEGDVVLIMECKPISKTKKFVIVKNESR